MKRYTTIIFFICFASLVIKCKNSEDTKKETIIQGAATVLVDETLTPIIEDQVMVFEDQYNAKINIVPKSEAEVIQALVKNSIQIAILSRTLNKEELKFLNNRNIFPKITPFAKDAIVFITNKSNKDTLIALNDVIDFLHGKKQSQFKGLVFDNPNSSTARRISALAGLDKLPERDVFSFKTNNEVIKYVSENDGMIGVVGLNYIYEPSPEMQPYTKKINVMGVKNPKDNQYYNPTQNDIAEGKYPLARDLFLVNCQGYSGLGMGFASFIAGETGQRIILKSGLVPTRVPSRKILIRNQINNDKNK